MEWSVDYGVEMQLSATACSRVAASGRDVFAHGESWGNYGVPGSMGSELFGLECP